MAVGLDRGFSYQSRRGVIMMTDAPARFAPESVCEKSASRTLGIKRACPGALGPSVLLLLLGWIRQGV
jgi:hypothetical protein